MKKIIYSLNLIINSNKSKQKNHFMELKWFTSKIDALNIVLNQSDYSSAGASSAAGAAAATSARALFLRLALQNLQIFTV